MEKAEEKNINPFRKTSLLSTNLNHERLAHHVGVITTTSQAHHVLQGLQVQVFY